MLPERFTSKFIITEDGHWLWTACTNTGGYGKFGLDGSHVLSHRFAWEQLNGSIPEGMDILHKNSCHTRACCNPDHCYLGTDKNNMQDRLKSGTNPMKNKTHCKQGHEYTPENTCIDKKGFRSCKICRRERALVWYHKNKNKNNYGD